MGAPAKEGGKGCQEERDARAEKGGKGCQAAAGSKTEGSQEMLGTQEEYPVQMDMKDKAGCTRSRVQWADLARACSHNHTSQTLHDTSSPMQPGIEAAHNSMWHPRACSI